MPDRTIMTESVWRLRDVAPEHLEAVRGSDAGRSLPPLVQRLVARQAFDHPLAVEDFLRPRLNQLADPFLIPGMAGAVDRMWRAIDARECVVLYGDYDVDGVSSLAMLQRLLAACGLEVRTFLPHRIDEGYGLNPEGLKRCLAECQPSLVLAADCGTTSLREIAELQARGIDVIVIDHHEVSPDGLPRCAAVVNPKIGSSFHYLCTSGLVFKFGHALLKRRRIDFDLRTLLDLAALGTVADVVPLTGDNRLIVAKGLRQMTRTCFPGLRALMNVSGITRAPRASDISFRLGPRLNAAGRLDHARDALELLVTEDEASALRLASRLDSQNRERRTVQAAVESQALAMMRESFDEARDPVIVLGARGWHPGVVGIVAGRLVRRYQRPCFIVAFDEGGLGKGSGRGIAGVSLVTALQACAGVVERGGGHDLAAGVTVSADRFDQFRERVNDSVRAQLGDAGWRGVFEFDGEIALTEINFETLAACECLEPYGIGNPQPHFLARAVTPAETSILREKHRCLMLEGSGGGRVRALWFDSAHRSLPPSPWDVALTMERGHFRGVDSIDTIVTEVRAAQ